MTPFEESLVVMAAVVVFAIVGTFAVMMGITFVGHFMTAHSPAINTIMASTMPISDTLGPGDRFELIISHFDRGTNQTLIEQKNVTSYLMTRNADGSFRYQYDMRDARTSQYLMGRLGTYDNNLIFLVLKPIDDQPYQLDESALKNMTRNLAYLNHGDFDGDGKQEGMIGLSTWDLTPRNSEIDLVVPWDRVSEAELQQ